MFGKGERGEDASLGGMEAWYLDIVQVSDILGLSGWTDFCAGDFC